MAHAEQLPNGTWRARYKRPDGSIGSRAGFLNRNQATEWAADQEALIRRTLWIDPRDAEVPFARFAHDWLEALRPRLHTTTLLKYESYLNNQILPQWRHWQMATIANSYVEIEHWVSRLHNAYAQQTISSVVALFSTILNAAVRARVISANPTTGVRVVRHDDSPENLIATPAQTLRAAIRLFDLGLGLRGFTLCVLNFYTGARWSELVGQQHHEYDHSTRSITIRHPLRETAGRVTKEVTGDSARPQRGRRTRRTAAATKTAAGARTVQLPPSVATIYERLLASHDHEYVLCTAKGHPWRRSNFTQRYWRPTWDGSDGERGTWQPLLPGITFHEGRHSHASWLAEDGVPEVARRARLGQVMAGIARVYDHVTPAMRDQTSEALEARWNRGLAMINDTERRWLQQHTPWLKLP